MTNRIPARAVGWQALASWSPDGVRLEVIGQRIGIDEHGISGGEVGEDYPSI